MVEFDMPTMFERMADRCAAIDKDVRQPAVPAVDVMEDDASLTVTVELPGVKKEDVDIRFESSVLSVSGERKPHESPQGARLLMHEIRPGSFKRSIVFEHMIDTDAISAEMNNGVLSITLPKSAAAKKRTIEVQ